MKLCCLIVFLIFLTLFFLGSMFILFAPDDFLNSVGIYHTVCIRIVSLVFGSVAVLMFIGVGKQVIAYEVE